MTIDMGRQAKSKIPEKTLVRRKSNFLKQLGIPSLQRLLAKL